MARGRPRSPLLEKTHPVPKIAVSTGFIFKRYPDTNRPIKNRMKQAPKNAINSLRSAWLSVNARLDRRRNNIAGRAILKANFERTVLAVLLNPNQRDNANPKNMSRKSGELFQIEVKIA